MNKKAKKLPDKWSRITKLPSNNITPLVKFLGQVTVSPDHFEKYGYITVSLVGLIAIGTSNSESPDLVNHAT